MTIHFLVEDPSSEEALRHIIPKIQSPVLKHKIINFGSKHKMLKVLPSRLAAYGQMLASGQDIGLVILIDKDTHDCHQLKARIEDLAKRVHLPTKSTPGLNGRYAMLIRIAIEELESWFLGDIPALCSAFSQLPHNVRKGVFNNPDNITGGAWEALHTFLKKYGIYRGVYPKIEAARSIAPHMDISTNKSRSFQCFITGVLALSRQP